MSDKDRSEFEKAARGIGINCTSRTPFLSLRGQYLNADMSNAWRLWQAALGYAREAEQPAGGDKTLRFDLAKQCARVYNNAHKDNEDVWCAVADRALAIINSRPCTNPDSEAEPEVARIAAIIERFWQLHSIEPSTGFTPEQLAKEICK